MDFVLRFKNGPFSPKAKKTESDATQNEAVSSQKKDELQFDTSISIILGSRLFKTTSRGYNLRFISEPLYRFLYGILFIVQQQ